MSDKTDNPPYLWMNGNNADKYVDSGDARGIVFALCQIAEQLHFIAQQLAEIKKVGSLETQKRRMEGGA